ncbi:hypothetical protein HYY71_04335 [Candidatus Woesearchaeota archaeon]|nr:hypothetical protein [Candidatus Woesearchaeota archaeon]
MKKNKRIVLLLLAFGFLFFFYTNEAADNLHEENEYLTAIKLAGEWFQNHKNVNFLYYEYLPFEKKHADETHPLREMGAMWAISKLSSFFDDAEHKQLAERGFRYFEQSFAYDQENDFYYVNITKDVKLGYSAFAILSLLELQHTKKDFYLNKFANGLLRQQQSDGSLSPFFFSNRSSGVDYYPGEALLALMHLYEYSHNSDYAKAVEKAFPYYLEYWKSNPNEAFVPWQTQAYYKLYKVNSNKEIAKFIFDMNDFIIKEYSAGSCDFFNFRKGMVIAAYIEGMNKAYQLAKERGDKKRAECYGNFIKNGSDYILGLQITKKSDFIEHFDDAAIGGFVGNANSYSMRVDRNQHAVMALMEAYQLGFWDN